MQIKPINVVILVTLKARFHEESITISCNCIRRNNIKLYQILVQIIITVRSIFVTNISIIIMVI